MSKPTPRMEITAEQFAESVAEFITHNQINVTKVSMEDIIKGYFVAQMDANEAAGQKVFDALS